MGRLVSIIVPVYNVEPYLSRCIESLLMQTYKEIEIILVNDGSTDNCPAICDGYAGKHEKIIVIHQKNKGLSSARNTGIKNAKGDYLAFVDSDDYISPNFIGRLTELILLKNSDIAQCGYSEVKKDKEITAEKNNCSVELIDKNELINNLYGERNIEFTVVWNKLFKRELFEDIEFPEGKWYEDVRTVYKLYYKCRSGAVTNEKLYYYFIHERSFISQDFNINKLDSISALEEQINFFMSEDKTEFTEKAGKSLFNLIMYNYSLALKSKKNKKEILDELKKIYRRNYNFLKRNKNIKKSNKLFIRLSGGRLDGLKPLVFLRRLKQKRIGRIVK